MKFRLPILLIHSLCFWLLMVAVIELPARPAAADNAKSKKVVNSALENIGRRPFIRWLTNIGVTYDTPPRKVQQAVEIIRSIVENHDGMHPDFPPRVFFNGFNDWNLNIMVLVWFHPPDYWKFQEWLQKTCVRIMEEFQAADIDFAFPSRTLYLANEDKRQLKLQLLEGTAAQEQPLFDTSVSN